MSSQSSKKNGLEKEEKSSISETADTEQNEMNEDNKEEEQNKKQNINEQHKEKQHKEEQNKEQQYKEEQNAEEKYKEEQNTEKEQNNRPPDSGDIAKKAREMKDKAKRMQNRKAVRNIITFLAVVISAVMQAFVIQAFIRPAELLSGGFTGIAILIDMLASTWGMSFPTSLGMLCINIPVAFICSRGISVRFTAFSLFQVFLTSGFLQFLTFKPLFDDPVLNVIFGGFLMGISVVIALKGNASSGGTDFIALFVSNKTGRSIWGQVFIGNCVLYCIFGLLFGWMNAAYSILFQFISTKTISTFHHRYDRVTLQITTGKAEEVMDAYINACKHGISCVEAVGGYSRKKMYVLHTVISSYEVDDIIRLMREVDPHIIINVFKTEQFYGKFYHAPLE